MPDATRWSSNAVAISVAGSRRARLAEHDVEVGVGLAQVGPEAFEGAGGAGERRVAPGATQFHDRRVEAHGGGAVVDFDDDPGAVCRTTPAVALRCRRATRPSSACACAR